MKKVTFLIFGHLTLVLGIVGAFLPVLPTTPFLLLAAYFYSKSNTKLHNWILNHKYFGESITQWHEHGVISKKAKALAAIMLILVMGLRIPSLDVHLIIKVVANSILLGVLLFVLSRPSKAKHKSINQDNLKL